VRWREQRTFSVHTILQAATQAAIKTAVDTLITAMVDDGTLTLYHSNGSTASSNSITACKILNIDFPESTGPEYANRRTIAVTFQGLQDVAGSEDTLAFQESVSYGGGGARNIYIPVITGLPKKYRVADNTPYNASQRGSAVARDQYPTAPAALFPSNRIHEGNAFERTTSYDENGDLLYELRWGYQFESAYPLVGSPNTWL